MLDLVGLVGASEMVKNSHFDRMAINNYQPNTPTPTNEDNEQEAKAQPRNLRYLGGGISTPPKPAGWSALDRHRGDTPEQRDRQRLRVRHHTSVFTVVRRTVPAMGDDVANGGVITHQPQPPRTGRTTSRSVFALPDSQNRPGAAI